MSYDKLITINYIGGFGGDFFANLLDSAVYTKPFTAQSDHNNKYDYRNEVVSLDHKYDFYMVRNMSRVFAYSKYPEFRQIILDVINKDLKSIMDDSFINDYKFFLEVNDSDDLKLKQNIVNVSREFIPPPESFEIANFHNIKFLEPGLALKDVFPSSKNIFLTSTEDKYCVLFRFLVWYKNKDVHGILDKSLRDFTGSHRNTAIPPNETQIYMDKLLFSGEYGTYETEVDQSLTQLIGQPIVLDKQALHNYRTENTNLIKTYFNLTNEDVLSDEVLTTIFNYMESIDA